MLPAGGATQGNGLPNSYYEYSLYTDNRTATSVHVVLSLRVRMQWFSNYFSFAIAHECTVNGVYQYANIKTSRKYWGHQWSGAYYSADDMYWDDGDYDYDGTNWHGWYTVFDGTVPMGVDDTNLTIIPCITRPPICGLGGDGIYGWNAQDVNNWSGCGGWWRPFWDDEQVGSYAWDGDHEDGAFLNNRWLDTLEGGYIGAYPRPAAPTTVQVSPSRIDVAVQDTQKISAKWGACQRAAGYRVLLSKNVGHSDATEVGKVSTPSVSFLPGRFFTDEIMDGDEFWVGVESYDGANVKASDITWSSPVTYYEIKSIEPSEFYVVGRKKTKDEILYKGEGNVHLYHTGESDGSYPIMRYELVRDDGVSVAWDRDVDVITFPGVERPHQTRTFTLKCYNTKGRPVYLASGEWLTVSIVYYGGLIYIWHDGAWREGIAYVYSGGAWHESDGVYVRKEEQWRTL